MQYVAVLGALDAMHCPREVPWRNRSHTYIHTVVVDYLDSPKSHEITNAKEKLG